MPVPPVIQMYRYVMGSGGGLGNLLKASEEFQQTDDWVRYPTNSQTPTVNADSRPDPNGGTTADQVGLTANTSARLQQTVTLSASTEYTFSVYARAVSGTVDFRMRNVTLKAAEVKTATTTGGDGGGFTRFTYTFTTTTAGPYELALQNDTNATAKDVIFWGAMLNQGGTALDYEYAAPTTGGSAPAPAYAGFGDAFGGVTAYYSLRQFTEAETLNAIRVRRSSDDTEQDIGFDSNGDLDTTALLAFVNADVDVYTSDFSVTEDLNEFNGTGAAAQSVGGVDDAYKFTLSGGNVQHTAFTSQIPLESQKSFTIIFDYYIPSGQTLSSIVFDNFGGSGAISGSLNVTDNWTTETINFTADGSRPRWWAGAFATNVNGDGDVFYLKNIVVTQTTADGAVTTFYDQSGNGNNVVEATASAQPKIVSAGNVITDGGKPSISIDQTTTNGLTIPIAASSTQDFFQVHKTNDDRFILLKDSDSGARYAYAAIDANTSTGLHGSYGTPSLYVNGSAESPANRDALHTLLSTNSQVLMSSVGGDSSAWTGDIIWGKYSSTNIYDGNVQEIIFFNSDQSTNRTGMETNINDHFSIYTP